MNALLVWRGYAVIWIWFSTLAAPVEYTTLGCLEPAIGAALARLGFINSRGHFERSIKQLMNSLAQIHKFVHATPFLRFYIIWIIITAAAVVLVVRLVGHASPRASQNIKDAPIPYTWMTRSCWHGRLTVPALLALFLTCYVALMVTWEDFAYYDYSMFTTGTLIGRDNTPLIVRESGRFIPLQHQEFNLIRHFAHTATGYHVLPIVELLIFSYILLILDSELSIMARAALAVLVLLTPAF